MKDRIAVKVIEGCVIFLIIFTPLVLGTVEDWSMSIMRMVAAFALAAWLFSILSPRANQPINTQKSIFSQPLVIPILIYLCVAIVSAIISAYNWISLSLLANLIAYIAVYFLIINNVNSETQVTRLIDVILLFSLFLGLYGILQYYGLISLTPRCTTIRATSTYYAPNYWAGYLIMVTPIAIAFFLFLPWSWRSVLMIVLSALLVINLAFSYSWGIVGFGIGMIFLAFIKIHVSRRKKLTAAVATLVLIFFAILGAVSMLSRTPRLPEETLIERYLHMRKWAPHNLSVRLFMYGKTIPYVLDHPYLETGPGTFIYAFPQYRPPERTNLWNYAHNDYLQISSEMGLTGLAAFLFFVISGWIKGFKALKQASGFKQAVIIGILAGILSILVHGFFDGNLTVIPANILYFYTLLGLLMVLVGSVESKVKSSSGKMP
mgnify:CR=1 FL=1